MYVLVHLWLICRCCNLFSYGYFAADYYYSGALMLLLTPLLLLIITAYENC